MHFGYNQKDWDAHLPAAFYAYNGSVSETTGDTTFFFDIWKITYHHV